MQASSQVEDQVFDLTRTLLGVLSTGSHVDDRSAIEVESIDDAVSGFDHVSEMRLSFCCLCAHIFPVSAS